MDKRLLEAIQDQINKELYSSYLYLAMSSWADSESWSGLSNWLFMQSKEEMEHAMILHKNLLERGQRSVFTEIAKPQNDWASPVAVFEEVYKHEQFVTSCINELATIAMECKDHAFYQFIQWFVKEQVEEEATASDLLARYKRLDGHPAMMDALDAELSKRVYTPPVVE